MFCPHCGHPSFSSVCKHCSLPSESVASRIVRRQGWPTLLAHLGVWAFLVSVLFLLMGHGVTGMLLGGMLGGMLGAAFLSLLREKRFLR